jgi:hypothetical protein
MINKKLFLLIFGIVVNFHSFSQWTDITSSIGGGLTSTTNMAKPYVFDLNNDNYPDFLVPVLTTVANPYTKYWRLYKNNGNSTFTDATNSYGLPTNLTSTLGFIDYNSDGFKDLYFITATGLQIFKNNNGTSFTNVSTQLGIPSAFFTSGETTSTFKVFDYDLDGDEDLLYTRTVSGANTLTAIVNNGTSFSTKVNILTSIPGGSAGINFSFFDMDNDGDFDVVFDGFTTTSQYSNGITTLYKKDATGYLNTTSSSGLVNGLPGEISTVDINQDGNLDIVKGGADCCTSPLYRVFIGNGTGSFTDQTSSYSISNGGYKGSPTINDYDNDTDFDFSWSGYTSTGAAPFRLYANNSSNVFTEVAATYGLNLGVTSGGVPIDDYGNGIWMDLDKDGDLDIILNREGSGSTSTTGNLWVKRNPLQGNYINIKLNGCGVNKSGIGAKIKLVVGAITKWLYYGNSPDGNITNGTDTFHFGLGTATLINSITVYWPNNTTTVLNNVSGNQFLTIGGGAGGSSAPTGSATQTLCSGSTIASLTATGTNIKWYATNTGGTALATTTTLVNGTTYYATQTVNGCESTTRLAVTVTLNNPTVTASSSTVCSGQPTTLTASSGTSTTSNFSVGSVGPSGGYVFYDQGSVINGWRYLEASPIDNGSDLGIGCYCVSIPNTSNLIGTGQTNTSNWISTGCAGAGSWLGLTQTLSINGFTNWFIPSKDELNLMYVNLKQNNLGNFQNIQYWTSSPGPYGGCGINGGAWVQNFSNGTQYSDYRPGYQGAGNLRLVRQFATGTPFSTYLWSTGATTASISVNPTATTQYWVDVTTNGVTCRKNITITVTPNTAPTGSATQTLCSGSTIASLTATGINIKWYATNTGGTALASTTALVNGTTYYASQTVSGCESTTRLAVIVSLNNPTVSATATTICGGSSVSLTASDGNNSQQIDNKTAQFSNNVSNSIGLNYASQSPTINFSYDFWFNTSRTITLLSEKTGGVSVQAVNGQNFVVFPTQPRGSGISVGTNGISVIEHSPNFLDSRFTLQTNLSGWHHCAVVYSNNNFSIYIDGVLSGSRINGTNFGGFGNTYTNVTLTQSIGDGYPGFDANDNYTGKLDEYRQWSVALTASQISQIYRRKLQSINMVECNLNLTFDQNTAVNNSNISSGLTLSNTSLPTFTSDNTFQIGGFTGTTVNNITNTNFTGTSASSYLWSTGATTASINVNPTATTQYWVDVTTNGVTCRKFITISVNSTTPAPTGNASQTLCSGSTIANLTATGTNIKWYSSSTDGTALASSTALVTGTTYYASQTVNGCESTTRLAVVVSLNTAAGISLTSGTSQCEIYEGCRVDGIVYTLSGGATGVTTTGLPYWVDVTIVGNTVRISSSYSQTGYYDYTITTIGGCGTSSVYGNIQVIPIPFPVLSSPSGTDNQSVCLGASIQNISYNSWQGSGVSNLPLGVSYYNNGFELIITGTPIESGVYYYTVYNFGQCQSSYGILGTIIVNSTPVPTGANNQTITQGSTFSNLVVAGQNIVWYSTPFEGTPLTLNTPLVNGTTYYASQTINGCESQDRLPVTVQFTLNNNEFDSINIVYNPNPVIDILYIKASTELKNAKICNVLGQTIFQQRFNSNEIQLNMSDFSTGTYFVIVESDDRKETFKILKK